MKTKILIGVILFVVGVALGLAVGQPKETEAELTKRAVRIDREVEHARRVREIKERYDSQVMAQYPNEAR